MLLAALGLHCGVAVHVARNLDGSTPAADKYDAKKAAQNSAAAGCPDPLCLAAPVFGVS